MELVCALLDSKVHNHNNNKSISIFIAYYTIHNQNRCFSLSFVVMVEVHILKCVLSHSHDWLDF